MISLSWRRFSAVLVKEFIQMRRDRLTFAMMVGIPLLQLVLFGYAINTDPKRLPTAVVSADASEFSRRFVWALQNTGYFAVRQPVHSEAEASRLLELGEVQFVVNIPVGFSQKLIRGERPVLLVEADATDPAATSNALSALLTLNRTALARELTGSLSHLKSGEPPFQLEVHRRYNPEGITQYNIVPGLMGVILTMTMVMMTALA
ncbi:MAG TPA: ABC transporter permease, partial [Burkholderiales bacterium]|nr:ABC transporter permease [Burkholderiales bacterium]